MKYFDLTLEDVIIKSEDIPGWLVANDQEITVALDIAITDELQAEGVARELVNKIQNLRKNSDFIVTDRIHVEIQPLDIIQPAINNYKDYIANEVLADSIVVTENSGEEVELFEGVTVRIALTK
jgi:isoleucyl-tRNA synthetase